MINERYGHKSVAVKNKLFVMGGRFINSCEVFDSSNNKFTLLKQPIPAPKNFLSNPSGVITIGSKIFVFRNMGSVTTYDFESDEWSEKTCETTKNLLWFSCARIPVTHVDK